MKAIVLTETDWEEYVAFCTELGIVDRCKESNEPWNYMGRFVIYTPKKAEDI